MPKLVNAFVTLALAQLKLSGADAVRTVLDWMCCTTACGAGRSCLRRICFLAKHFGSGLVSFPQNTSAAAIGKTCRLREKSALGIGRKKAKADGLYINDLCKGLFLMEAQTNDHRTSLTASRALFIANACVA